MTDTAEAKIPKDLAIRAIRVQFIDGLEGRLAELETLFDLLEDSKGTSRIWAEIRMRAHKISGVAGIFGFSTLGARAALLDRGIEAFLNDPQAGDDSNLRAALVSLLDDIDAILECEMAA